MPKIVECIICGKSFLGTTYTLIEHHNKCTPSPKNDTPYTANPTVQHVTKPKHCFPKPNSSIATPILKQPMNS